MYISMGNVDFDFHGLWWIRLRSYRRKCARAKVWAKRKSRLSASEEPVYNFTTWMSQELSKWLVGGL